MKKFILPFLLFGLLVSSCTEEADFNTLQVEEVKLDLDLDNITDIEIFVDENDAVARGKNRASFSTAIYALYCTGLLETVLTSDGTLFAPTDEAFAKLGLDKTNICEAFDAETLTQILTYHFNADAINTQKRGCFIQLNGDLIQITRPTASKYFINEAKVARKFKSRSLTVYQIKDVLLTPDANIVETAVAANDFNALVSAVLAASPDIAAALSDEDAVWTVFAPTDEAFGDLLAALGLASLEEAVAAVGVEGLSTILLYHVVDGCAVSNTLEDGAEVMTLQGETITIDLEQLSLIDKSGAPAGLIPSLLDIRTSNGVIHAIDKVLLPQEIIDAL